MYMKEHHSLWIQSMNMRFEQPCVQGSILYFQYDDWSYDDIQVTVISNAGDIIAKGSFSVIEGMNVT
ncbi:hypothetical protein D3C81_2296120 [compost metagenome]